jgi:hypothetical protein
MYVVPSVAGLTVPAAATCLVGWDAFIGFVRS